ncbi:MAG: uracil-DNA glycosylase [Dehalococcoidia bacterium]
MTELATLNAQISACESCGLCKTRTHAVPGEGPSNAEIMFVGEGPGFHEDQQGRPFVGPAGRFLEELLGSIGLSRSDVYIANVVKCRPPGNRDPLPNEIDSCRPYLLRQIELIDPKLIVTLGRFSLSFFFPQSSISKMHGHLQQLNDRHYFHLYHPAAALHAGNLRQVIQQDFAKIPQALDKVRERQPVAVAAAEPPVEQGRLF